MHVNLRRIILCLAYLIAFNYVTHAENNSQVLPEHLEEITLDNIEKIQPLLTFSTTHIDDVAWSSDGRYLVASAQDGMWVYDFNDKVIQSKFVKTETSVGKITFIPKSSQFITGMNIYDAATLKVVKPRPDKLDYVSTDGTLYAHADDYSITVYDAQNNEQLRSIPILNADCGYACYITDIAFSPDNRYIAFSSAVDNFDNGVVEISTGKMLPIRLDGVWGLTYSSDGSILAYSYGKAGFPSRDGVRIIDSLTGKEKSSLQIYGSTNAPIFSRDGQLLVIGGVTDKAPNLDEAYGTLYFFDMKQMKVNTKLTARDAIRSDDTVGWVNSVAFSSDYHLLATGTAFNYGPTGQVIIWGVPSKS